MKNVIKILFVAALVFIFYNYLKNSSVKTTNTQTDNTDNVEDTNPDDETDNPPIVTGGGATDPGGDPEGSIVTGLDDVYADVLDINNIRKPSAQNYGDLGYFEYF